MQGRNSYTDRDGVKYGIAIHNTSNTASAAQEAAYAQRRTDGVSAHLFADGVQVIQSLDLDARAGHAGSSQGNENAVSVEICGVNGWTRDHWLGNVAWEHLGAALAYVVKTYRVDVRRASVAEMRTNPKVRAFYSHDDMRQAWGGTDHTDPGPNFPWDTLFAHVKAALGYPRPRQKGIPMFMIRRDGTPAVYLVGGAGGPLNISQRTLDMLTGAGFPYLVCHTDGLEFNEIMTAAGKK